MALPHRLIMPTLAQYPPIKMCTANQTCMTPASDTHSSCVNPSLPIKESTANQTSMSDTHNTISPNPKLTPVLLEKISGVVSDQSLAVSKESSSGSEIDLTVCSQVTFEHCGIPDKEGQKGWTPIKHRSYAGSDDEQGQDTGSSSESSSLNVHSDRIVEYHVMGDVPGLITYHRDGAGSKI